MSTSTSARRSALAVALVLFAVVLLAAVSTAWAGNITYSIVNYPGSQTDSTSGGADTINGLLTTDGSLGTLNSSDFVSASFVITTPGGTVYRVPSARVQTAGTSLGVSLLALATPTQLSLPGDYELVLFGSSTSGYNIAVEYFNIDPLGPLHNVGYRSLYGAWHFPAGGGGGTPIWDSGGIATNPTWIIATAVPEPSTFALLGSGLLGLGVVYLRRRRQRHSSSLAGDLNLSTDDETAPAILSVPSRWTESARKAA